MCGQAENAAQLEKIEAATAWPLSGSLSAEDVTARTNGEYLSVAFETAGSLTQPTGRVRLALPAGLLEGKTLVRIAPDGTQTELPFEAKNGRLIFTLDFANSELPVMLFRLVPQTTVLCALLQRTDNKPKNARPSVENHGGRAFFEGGKG